MNQRKWAGKTAWLLLASAAIGPLSAQESKGGNGDGGLIKNQLSPHARVHSVNLDSVRWADGFWAKRFETAASVTLPALWDLAADPEAGHAWQNMRIAAGLEKGERRGSDWQDAWLYKWVESASYVYGVTGNAKLDTRMDEVIAVIAKAQEPDGYIATQTQIRPGLDRYESENHHELYTMGHLITAACMHHRITGKTSFLEVAKEVADHIYRTFRNRDPALANFPINPSIIMAGVELYRTTGVKDYLDMAIGFVDGRGSAYGNGQRNIWGKQKSGASDLNQNWKPLREETEVVGHAVFFTYLFAGATDVYLETGDRTLLSALERLWLDLTEKKMFITGGVSPVHKAHPMRSFSPGTLSIIKSDSIHEGAGAPYDLPNDTAYNETCGQIGNVMWNW
ncbi:MAG: glycoside hydrolase family 127 protein, partial [Pseudomonadales bacterium]